jgi:hypothetical protein
MELIEAAFLVGEGDEDFWTRIIWKCPACGRRSRTMKKGPGTLAQNLPIQVTCKLGHENLVKPYQT